MIYGQLAILLLLSGCCGVMRRYQGSADHTWPWKRVPYRMLVWLAPTSALAFVGIWMGVSWPLACAAASLPVIWSSLKGDYNSFAIWALMRRRTTYKFAEGLQGGLGGLIAAGIIIFLALA